MIVLGLDTCLNACSVAVLDGDRVLAHATETMARGHQERLAPMAQMVMAAAALPFSRLDRIGATVGPGSFTGLRVGVATAQGLAIALDVPVAPVPTLDALAATLPFAEWPVCPVVDARKGEVYLSLYRWTGDAMKREWDYLALPPESAIERLAAPVIVLGDGVPACQPFLARLGAGVRIASPAHSLPSPAVVGELGHAMLESGQGVAGEALTPLYLRPSEAELRKKHG